jgi:glycosyltransferase involved in cell wall biosynthesis
MSRPLVSVILPTHNRADLLPRAIYSVLGQSYRNLELWVIDDASTDATPQVLKQFDDPRLHVLRLPKSGRAGAARNAGIRQARGTLLAFQDDDDIWLVHKLERQVEHLLRQPAEIGLNLCGFLRLYADDAHAVIGPEYFRQLRFDRGMVGDFSLAATPCWLLKREALDGVGEFDASLPLWEDWELLARLSHHCRFAYVDEPLFVQDRSRPPGAGMSQREYLFAEAYRRLIEKHGHGWSDRKALARQLYLIGRNEAMYGISQAGRPWLWRALRADPANAKAWTALALSYAGSGAVRNVTLRLRSLRARK